MSHSTQTIKYLGSVKIKNIEGYSVSVKSFDVAANGITDDTEKVRRAHIRANQIGCPVSYAGIDKIAIQANARIPVHTSVDFSNCEVVILGGVKEEISFTEFNVLYSVRDPDCPLEYIQGLIPNGTDTTADLTKNSYFPTRGIFNGHGFAKIETTYKIPSRYRNSIRRFQQSFKINRNGRASYPLVVDLTDQDNFSKVWYRKTSEKKISLSNFSIVEGVWNNQIVFDIQRCNVEVNNITLMFVNTETYDNVCQIIFTEYCSDIYINNFITTGRPVSQSIGSYCLSINSSADIYINNMNAITGWGSTNSNYSSGIHYENCILNRVDAHEGGFNIIVNNCVFHDVGVQYGNGGGVISVKNSRFYDCQGAVSSRVDYGGNFFGDVVVSDCEFYSRYSTTLRVVDLRTLGATTTCKAPNSVIVRNIKRVDTGPSGNFPVIMPIDIKVDDATFIVIAPQNIVIHNITGTGNWIFNVNIDVLNMEQDNDNFGITDLFIANVIATRPPTSTQGITSYSSIRSPTNRMRIRGTIVNCNNINFRLALPNNVSYTFDNCSITGFSYSGPVPYPRTSFNNCFFNTLSSGYTTCVLGTPVNSSRYTSISNCEILGAGWDLSNVKSSIGTLIRPGTTAPTLPDNVTVDDLFTGWKDSSFFV